MQGVKLCLQKLRYYNTSKKNMLKIKNENMVFSELQEVKPN